MYMSVPTPLQNPLVSELLHCQWQLWSMSAQLVVIVSVQQGSLSEFRHWIELPILQELGISRQSIQQKAVFPWHWSSFILDQILWLEIWLGDLMVIIVRTVSATKVLTCQLDKVLPLKIFPYWESDLQKVFLHQPLKWLEMSQEEQPSWIFMRIMKLSFITFILANTVLGKTNSLRLGTAWGAEKNLSDDSDPKH